MQGHVELSYAELSREGLKVFSRRWLPDARQGRWPVASGWWLVEFFLGLILDHLASRLVSTTISECL